MSEAEKSLNPGDMMMGRADYSNLALKEELLRSKRRLNANKGHRASQPPKKTRT